MFRHRGETRTLQHNLKIASLLSSVAGLVNVAGFLSVQQLTTNVTGHFAFFIDEVFQLRFLHGIIYFVYIFFFFAGSFVSNFLVEWMYKRNHTHTYNAPVLLECICLLLAVAGGEWLITNHPDVLACMLLFAMGLQNSLVTTLSNATVRTTHLTGLFTDLGIELSQLFFYRKSEEKTKLLSSIRLRFTIIGFFFIGGIAGGILYSTAGILSLIAAVALLLSGLVFDYVKLSFIRLKRR